MPYGTVKCDNLIYDDSGDVTLAVNNINTKANPSFTGTVTSTATLNQTGQWNQNGGYHQTLPANIAIVSNNAGIDCALGSFFIFPGGGQVSQWRFTNVPASGKSTIITMKWYYAGSTISWNAYVDDGTGNYVSKNLYWAGGSAPTMGTGWYFLSWQTDDGGNTWRLSTTKAFAG